MALSGYWLRLIAAWLLLWFAGRLMKDAEKLFHTTAGTREFTIDGAASNGQVEVTDAIVVEAAN